MSARARIAAAGALALALLAGLAAGAAAAAQQTAAERGAAKAKGFRVLVFSRTTGFRHYSIPTGVAAIHQLGAQYGFRVDNTEDPSVFRPRKLSRYAVVVFLNTTGTVLDAKHKRALRRYIVRRGGGYVGIHSAADTEHEWPFYERLVGALFLSHPLLEQPGRFANEAPNHPATKHLDPSFWAFDEFYSFKRNPRERVRVLLSVDESTYLQDPNTSLLGGPVVSGKMGDHPMSWCHDVGRGRSFYTALGHEAYLYGVAWYRRHILGGIRVAAGAVKANCSPRR